MQQKPNFISLHFSLYNFNVRLKSGWSLKTESLGYQNTEHIGADEQATIISVIKRAEQVDKIEQERVSIYEFII